MHRVRVVGDNLGNILCFKWYWGIYLSVAVTRKVLRVCLVLIMRWTLYPEV